MRYILLLLIFSLLVSCSSTAGIRQTKPTGVKIYSGNFKDVANCTAEKLDERFEYYIINLRINDTKKYARIFVTNSDTGNTIFDFLFKQDEQNNTVTVESRGMWGQSGGTNRIWPLIDKCAETMDRQN